MQSSLTLSHCLHHQYFDADQPFLPVVWAKSTADQLLVCLTFRKAKKMHVGHVLCCSKEPTVS